MFGKLDLTIRDSVLDPAAGPQDEKRVQVKRIRGNKPHYKVWLFVEGNDLPYVRCVTYTLHKTFPNPVRRVNRSASNPHCQLIIWTWGLFVVGVTIEDKRGDIYELTHQLTYDQQLAEEDINYIWQEDSASRTALRPRSPKR